MQTFSRDELSLLISLLYTKTRKLVLSLLQCLKIKFIKDEIKNELLKNCRRRLAIEDHDLR